VSPIPSPPPHPSGTNERKARVPGKEAVFARIEAAYTKSLAEASKGNDAQAVLTDDGLAAMTVWPR
jgi:hypothetical protein